MPFSPFFCVVVFVLVLHIPRVKNRHISSILVYMHFMMYTWQDAYKEVKGYEVAWMAA